MSRFKNEVSPEALEKSFKNRKYVIDWNTLKPFKYLGKEIAEALDGWSICHKVRVRIGVAGDTVVNPTRSTRPMAVFYKLKAKIIVKDAHFLNDNEADRFEAKLSTKH